MMKDRTLLSRLWQAILQPLRREDGTVTTEAVMILPLLAFFYCATFVWFDAFRQKTLVMKASYAISDVISRQSEIDEAEIDDLRDMLDYMIPSHARPRLRVSQIMYNTNVTSGNKYVLRWSYAPDGFPALTQEDLDRDQSWIPVMGHTDHVTVTETAVSYQPIFRVGIKDTVYRNLFVTPQRFDDRLHNRDAPEFYLDIDDEDDDGDGYLAGTGDTDSDEPDADDVVDDDDNLGADST